MGWLKDRKEKRKRKKYIKRTLEEEITIFKRRLSAGESITSAGEDLPLVLKWLKKQKKKKKRKRK